MIPKFICWLFGHVLRYKDYAGCDVRWEGYSYVTYYKTKWYTKCPRCGEILHEEADKSSQ